MVVQLVVPHGSPMHGEAVQPRGVPAESGLAQFLQTPPHIFFEFS